MFQVLDSKDHYIGIKLSGKIDKEEYRLALLHLKQKFLENNQVDLLIDISDLDYGSSASIWEDLKSDIKNFPVIQKLAVVGSRENQRELSPSLAPLVKQEAKYFPKEDEARAREWVH